jgi:hypothetical protein
VQINTVAWSAEPQKKKEGMVKQSIYAYISPIWEAAHSQPIVTVFGTLGGLADLIKY